jgi:protease I
VSQKRALILIAPNFQDEEATEPAAFLAEQGVEVVFAGLEKGMVAGKNGRASVEVETTVDEVSSEDFDLLLLPGGSAPETLRLHDRVLELTRSFFELPDRVVAAICHGPQILISAQVLPGRTLTCYAGIRDDVKLAGARYVDKKVHVDGRLITSRIPDDIPAFNEALAAALFPPVEEPVEAPAVEEDSDSGAGPGEPGDVDESVSPLDVESS